MLLQDFYLPRYRWHVRVYYAVTTYWAKSIEDDLWDIGCRGADFHKARVSLENEALDTGLTYSNGQGETVMVIGLTSSPAQFQNSLDHEKGHLCRHISQACGIDPFSEEEQYLNGEIGQKMFPVASKFLCEHCRREIEPTH